MKQVPFFENTPDNTHCYQASLKMILKYFLPEKEYSWDNLEKLTAKKEGLWTWPTQSFMSMLKLGFDVIEMDDFDNQRFIDEGGSYLIEKYGKEVGEIQIKMSDIPHEKKLMKEYQKYNKHKIAIPEFTDLKKLLDEGYLLICNVNSYSLENKEGYAGHAVVVFDYDKEGLYLHDPGLPSKANWKIPYDLFQKAWDYPDKSARNFSAFKH